MKIFADFDAIKVGDRERIVRRITEQDVRRFVEMTGDDNPLHVDPRFAETTSFKDIVVHGMLGASFISTVIGTKLPGPGALWVSQQMDFLHPVRLGDELTITCTVLKKNDRERLVDLETKIENQNAQVVLAGSGRVKVLTERAPAPVRVGADRPRVAVVTGGAGGIGAAICRRLASDGLHVVVNYRRRKDAADALVAELEKGKASAIAVQADVSTDAGVKTLLDAAERAFGGVDVLINNASPKIAPKPLASADWTDFQRHLDAQVRAAFLLAQACAPGMASRQFGRIVNLTSQVIDGIPTPHWTSYAVAKSALATLSRYLAVELGPSGITVNCVSPGMTDTSLIGDIPEKQQMILARQTPLRRLAVPTDVAGAVSYLVSDDSAFITGQTLRVNGGSVVS